MSDPHLWSGITPWRRAMRRRLTLILMPTQSETSLPSHPGDRLAAAIRRAGAPLCVGLDPVVERLPPELARLGERGLHGFTEGILEACAPFAAAVKFQSACYERHHEAGITALRSGIRSAKSLGLLTILDAKRGDIGISADHYAASMVALGADWVTVNGYMGSETVAPYLNAGLGVFVLVRTSNPGSHELQSLPLADGRTVAEAMADMVAALGDQHLSPRGASAVGAVVGATQRNEIASLRKRMARQCFLLPGIGAQGATIADVQGAFDPATAGALATSSRAIIYAPCQGGETWMDAASHAASQLADELRGCAPSTERIR
ncbi:MAG: orotidine-5'-phosphate decarboxylase [Planctomycetota bacterium]|nr:orotidine-5'-phosphate decarboxylase [Planctomycetota bacterium]